MKYLFLLLILIAFKANSQDREEALKLLRVFKPVEASKEINLLDDSLEKSLMQNEVNYLLNGVVDSLYFFNKPQFINNEDKILFNLYYGDFLRRNSNPNQQINLGYSTFDFKLKAINLYTEALNLSQKTDGIYEKESLWRILDYYTKNSTRNAPNLKNFEKYLHEFSGQKNPVYSFWYAYFKLAYKIILFDEGEKIKDLKKAEFTQLRNLAKKNSYLLGRAMQLEALCYDLYFKDVATSYKVNLQAQEQYNNIPYYFGQYRANTIELNIATDLKNLGKDQKSKKMFLSILSDSIFEKSERLHKSDVYNGLSELYKKEGKNDSALYINELFIKHEQQIKRYQNAIAMHAISERSDFQKLKNNFLRYRWYYGAALSIVFLIAIYSLVRWKKADKKEKKIKIKLEALLDKEKQLRNKIAKIENQKIISEKEVKLLKDEMEQTLQEIERLKKITILEHIVLINGVRLPISELVYIKADGHFLHFFTENNREFVSGTLKNILRQLPPNFIQTHRAFIVNLNFVHYSDSMRLILKDKTEIRIGRTYKEQVKKMIALSNALK
jgi:hypothetical protein